MRQVLVTFTAAYALVLGAVSCGGSTNTTPIGTTGPSPTAPGSTAPGPTSSGQTTAGYIQVERLGRGAVKEGMENFANHQKTNSSSPDSAASDAVLATSIHDFVKNVAGRDEAHATALVSILIPDELKADLSQAGGPTTGGYLGIETGGAAGPIKSAFGGRWLMNDLIDTNLYAIFGTALSDLKLVPDDGKSSPCLTTDNVSAPGPGNGITTTFPYVGTPR